MHPYCLLLYVRRDSGYQRFPVSVRQVSRQERPLLPAEHIVGAGVRFSFGLLRHLLYGMPDGALNVQHYR